MNSPEEAVEGRGEAQTLIDAPPGGQGDGRPAGAGMSSGDAAQRAARPMANFSQIDDWIRQNPWGGVAVAASVGLTLGMLMHRSRD